MKCRQSAERMKASLVGFITCNGLKGPSESHLLTSTRKGQIHVIHFLVSITTNSFNRFESSPGIGDGGELGELIVLQG